MGDPVTLEMWINSLAPLGVGGVLAAFLFYFYRKDVKGYTDQWRGQTEMLIQVVRDNTTASTAVAEALRNHTTVLHENTEVMQAVRRRLDVLDALDGNHPAA